MPVLRNRVHVVVLILVLLAAVVPVAMPAEAVPGNDSEVFINEIHYDNDGEDVDEGFEIAGPAGTDLAGWSAYAYNGSNGAIYDDMPLSGVIDDEGDGFGALSFEMVLQNGSPDGLALVDDGGVLVQFLSYEGSFEATDGPAQGETSTDIVRNESSTSPIGDSLQLVGTGLTYGDFDWQIPTPESMGAINSSQSFGDPPPPPEPLPMLISEVQGSGAETPVDGVLVEVTGVVVGDYEGPSPNLRGFFLQEEEADMDSDPATSEGVFVFNNIGGTSPDLVALGDAVTVTGTVGEFQGQTQITADTVAVVSSDNTATPTEVELPFPDHEFPERYEGMHVTFPQDLYVTEFFQLGRFGDVVVSSGDRLQQPTAVAAPGGPANQIQASNDLNRIKVDDATNDQNPDPILFGGGGDPLTADNPLRGGDTLSGAEGVFTWGWAGNSASPNTWRLRVVGDLSDVSNDAVPVFNSENPRPTEVPDTGGTLRIVGFNVLNYFVTLDDGGADCGPTGSPQECRGAEDAEEFERQRTKLLAALTNIDADVFGLVELENTDGAEPLEDLVAGLNEAMGAGTYDYIETGTIGTDVIKVGVIYKPDSVTPVGEPAVLDSSVDSRFDDDRNRPTLAVAFEDNVSGGPFYMAVNHLKSKGCGDATGPDADQGDGQGCWNSTRANGAEAMVDWLAGYPTGVETDGVVLGDLNSYAKEDPITVLTDAGFVDLAGAYSYVFDGQWGYLDYAMVSPDGLEHVAEAVDFHINADEVPVLDYNTNFKSPGQIDSLYAPDQFRTSDHDPILVGFDPMPIPFEPVISVSPEVLSPPDGDYHPVDVSAETTDGDPLSVTITGVTSSEADSGLGPEDRAVDVVPIDDDTVNLRAEAFADSGRVYTVSAEVSDGDQTSLEQVTVTVPVAPGTPPPTTEPPPTTVPGSHPGFDDVPDDHLFHDDIQWLAEEGITIGCNPPANTLFCPADRVTRGQMAAFLNRTFGLAETDTDHFGDDEDSVFEDDINRLAEADITIGCNPPENTEFCPNKNVLRQEMASFLTRAYGFVDDAPGTDRFVDDDGSVHEADIEALASAGVTYGCNPPDNTMFCSGQEVLRQQMAAFLHRAD
ncbi:MAG: ExeM/NucH family extracellular endonuclease [Acidimicrobiia bacterium]|nr:ExeM/NucH family extracellular endonuclease [Acidimicrobiia bacterium]